MNKYKVFYTDVYGNQLTRDVEANHYAVNHGQLDFILVKEVSKDPYQVKYVTVTTFATGRWDFVELIIE